MAADNFSLHPQLSADCHRLGESSENLLLLLDDANYPWFILVPKLPDIRELHALEPGRRTRLVEQGCLLADFLYQRPACDKVNHGAIGNLVPQLHYHVVGRSASDPLWPGVVWQARETRPYSAEQLALFRQDLREALGREFRFTS